MIYASENCPVCRYGLIGYWRCANSEALVLMCDECNSIWRSPLNLEEDNILEVSGPPSYIVLDTGCKLMGNNARWATKEEVFANDWGNYILGSWEPNNS